MKVYVLGSGTSTGVPELGCRCDVCLSTDPMDQRMRASIVVEVDDEVILVDCGPDFRTQMLRTKAPMPTALILTHHHYDHVAGIDDLRPFAREHHFPVYANAYTGATLQKSNAYMFEPARYPGVPQVSLHLIDAKPFRVGDVEVIPIQVMHYKLPVLGFRIKNFAYVTDFSTIAEEEIEKLKGVEVLIIEGLRHDPHIAHVTLKESIAIAQKIGAKEVYFTHISHTMGHHAAVNATLPKGMFLAYDGLQLSL